MSVELDRPAEPDTAGAGLPVNWELAAATGARLVAPGPSVTPEQAAAEVARLHDGARVGEEHVRQLTGLGAGLPVPDADVLDRPGWIRAAVGGMSTLVSDVRLPARASGRVAAVAGTVTSTASGVQLGALLSFLGARVLGQYDPFGGPEHEGRLLLIAPNVTAAHCALEVDGADFALWVCLHEATHRLQFTAMPWLRDHFRNEVTSFASGIDRGAAAAVERLPEILRSVRSERPKDGLAVIELLQGPEQRAVLDRLLALTTLLEGHAEHVMDAVGPEVVPSVATIRERFTARRRGTGLVDRLLRTLLGVDAKVRQYEQGRTFVDHVVDAVGMEGLNAAWTSPETLPLRAEITDPGAWLARVHG